MQLNKRFFVCTNNNTSNIEIIALFCDFTFNSWISSVDQCILQDFSSSPFDCKFAEFFSVSSIKKKKKTRIDCMLPSSVVRTKTAGTPSAYDCVTNVELTCSVIHYWTDWRQNETYSFYTIKRKEKLQTCWAPPDCSRIDIIQVTNATFPPFFFFSSLFNC